MHPYLHARTTPDKPACIFPGAGETITYRELDERSNQGAHVFRSLGLVRGDVVAMCMESHPRYLEIAWAAQRSGLYLVHISSKLTAPEAEYIVMDSGARAFVTSAGMGEFADAIAPRLKDLKLFMVARQRGPYASWEAACRNMPHGPIADQSTGNDMLYSSGTTGRPKGVKVALLDDPIDTPTTLTQLTRRFFGLSEQSIYLSPAPLYHAAPLRWCMTLHQHGGTVVQMDRFDAEGALALIERYKATCSQWVPTHFVRLLRLPHEVRARYDLSSLELAVHAAAPCAIDVKRQMIEWWGPILFEYYAGTEGNGMTAITSKEWLQRPGSVGRAIHGELHICDDAGEPVPPQTQGTVYFGGTRPFAYHNSPEKTRGSYNRHGWSTLGDVGYVDRDGYLFLTDRKAFMIISGGVNIYPQEIENLLISHPAVLDVAVVGGPDEEMGERVIAVVQPVNVASAGKELADDLLAYARARLSHVKVPKVIEFTHELPRHPNGKLYKRLLRDKYWGVTDSTIV